MGLGERLTAFYNSHRTAVLAAGGVAGVGGLALVRKHGTSSSGSTPAADGTGYPAAYTTGATTPTYDTTATDAWSQFGDQAAAAQDYQAAQFSQLQDTLGQIETDISAKTPTFTIRLPKQATAPRPPKPKAKPKAPAAKRLANPKKPAPPRRRRVKAKAAPRKPKKKT